MRKIFLVIIFSIILVPAVSFARMADPNLLPKNEPLRPPAENILPNFENNINAGTVETTIQEEQKKNEEKTEIGNVKETEEKTPELVNKKNVLSSTSQWSWLMVGMVIVLIIGSVEFFRRKNKVK